MEDKPDKSGCLLCSDGMLHKACVAAGETACALPEKANLTGIANLLKQK